MNSKEKRLIKSQEGYRSAIYRDTLSNLSGGWGHAFLERSVLPLGVWENIFEWDFGRASGEFFSLRLNHLDPVRRAVIISMLYNLGYIGVLGFKKMLHAVRFENWELAKAEMIDSAWHNQVGDRAAELEDMMLTGQWPEWMEKE